MSVVVDRVGLAVVKGLSWASLSSGRLVAGGVVGDRHWSPVTRDLTCIKATDHPEMVGMWAGPSAVPRADEVLFDGAAQTVRYYDRPVTARVFGGPLADRISAAAGRQLLLACSEGPGHFLWSSPVSVLLRSELQGLPDDVARYRANLVLDDRDDPLSLMVGSQLEIEDVVLEVERELQRCVVINHEPTSGAQDASLMRSLRGSALLGYGCRVIRAGAVRCGDPVRVVCSGR